jgi:chromate transporter
MAEDIPATTPPSIAHLFLSFLRLGATAFGGPSMVAYIRKLAVAKKRWLDDETFRAGVALCQSIPGATAMQTAAYVGLRTRGMAGAAATFIGFGLPAFLLMMGFAALYSASHTLPAVASALSGLQAIVVAVVANAAWTFGRATVKNWRGLLIAGVAAGLFAVGLNPLAVIPAAAILGLVLMRDPAAPPSANRPAPIRTLKPVLRIIAAACVGLVVLAVVNSRLFDLATLMTRVDLLAFGGGFASVPLMQNEVVHVRGWLDNGTFLNGIVLGQVTPGPIVITATFIGYMIAGPLGALVGTVFIFLPSFVVVTGIVPYFDRLRGLPWFNRALAGVLSSFVGLLLTVTFRFAFAVPWDPIRLVLAIAALVALLRKVDILWVVVAGAAISVAALR